MCAGSPRLEWGRDIVQFQKTIVFEPLSPTGVWNEPKNTTSSALIFFFDAWHIGYKRTLRTGSPRLEWGRDTVQFQKTNIFEPLNPTGVWNEPKNTTSSALIFFFDAWHLGYKQTLRAGSPRLEWGRDIVQFQKTIVFEPLSPTGVWNEPKNATSSALIFFFSVAHAA